LTVGEREERKISRTQNSKYPNIIKLMVSEEIAVKKDICT